VKVPSEEAFFMSVRGSYMKVIVIVIAVVAVIVVVIVIMTRGPVRSEGDSNSNIIVHTYDL
jgi:ABC-type transporter Mla subunit MlaD